MGATNDSSILGARNDTPDLSLGLALIAGLLYLLAAFWGRQLIQQWLGLPPRFTPEGLRSLALSYVAANILAYVPAVLCLILAWRRPHPNSFRDYLRPEPAFVLIVSFLGIVVAKVVLNNLGYWPFSWRLPDDSARTFAATLVRVGRWDALILWLLFLCFVVPFLEEVVFRYAVLGTLRRRTTTGISTLLSALLFGVTHLGFGRTNWQLVDFVWLFCFGILLAHITIRRSAVTIPIIAHIALNTITGLVLLLSVT